MTFGWDSLESITAIHRWTEVAGFVFLGLLLVSEVISFVYGNQKDVLTEQATNRQLENVKASQQERRLSTEQKNTLIGVLSPYRGQKVSLSRIMGDVEAEPFANDFLDVLVNAGWMFDGKPEVSQSVYGRDPIGIEVTLNQGESEAGRMLPAANALITTLATLKLIDGNNAFMNPEVPTDGIQVRIGKRPPIR